MKFDKSGRYAHVSDCGKYNIPAAKVMGFAVFSAVAGNEIIFTARAPLDDVDGRNAAWRECADACEAHAGKREYMDGAKYGRGYA